MMPSDVQYDEFQRKQNTSNSVLLYHKIKVNTKWPIVPVLWMQVLDEICIQCLPFPWHLYE